ncbi:hypothetical protein [Gynuella sunshinyii]|uniref:Chemotaxis protein CheC, inhibitor of MCP methylation n=1 Tax=Gynuella sunshinyii YC6258 TaxID=1445510 RepID=A0A0C5VRC9_9GAMM|nr:hypothetical protein [Gynuella sunshinyii]AJQ95973.1 chemotaxis protein CheC, inhibitor of MCP methylation [Gynuella sunshinyii YC6258]
MHENFDEVYRDCFQEITNVAMGQAADLLARILNVFIVLPIPNVNILESSELHMALSAIDESRSVSAVCQGFIGGGISGEALLIFNDSSFSDVAHLRHNFNSDINENVELELLMDISNVLIGACLRGIADQLDLKFSQGHPKVLGRHVNVEQLIKTNAQRWKKTLAIEVNYTIEEHDVNCDLLLLFTEDSFETLKTKADYLLE